MLPKSSARFQLLALALALLLITVMLASCVGDKGRVATVTQPPAAIQTAASTPTFTVNASLSPTASKEPVKIGTIANWSGLWAIADLYYANRTIQLVEKQVRDMGGILAGRPVEFLKYYAAPEVLLTDLTSEGYMTVATAATYLRPLM